METITQRTYAESFYALAYDGDDYHPGADLHCDECGKGLMEGEEVTLQDGTRVCTACE